MFTKDEKEFLIMLIKSMSINGTLDQVEKTLKMVYIILKKVQDLEVEDDKEKVDTESKAG